MPIERALAAATRAFLHKNYPHSLLKLSEALAYVPATYQIWYEQLDAESPDKPSELRRKALLLLITLSASIWTSSKPEILSQAHNLDRILFPCTLVRSAQPKSCFAALLECSVSFYAPEKKSGDIQYLPPSVVASLAMAALKLDVPQEAKQLIDSWDSSLSNPTCQALAEESQRIHEARALDSSVQSLSDRKSLSASENLEDSTVLNTSRIRAATLSYERVIEVYCVAVLPRLGDWKGASDRIERASFANGGVLNQSRIDSLHASLTRAKKRKESEEQQKAKQAATEQARAASPTPSKNRSSKRIPNAGGADARRSANARRTSDSSSLSGGDPSSASVNGSPTQTAEPILHVNTSDEDTARGFASLRVALARFIAPREISNEERQLARRPTTVASLRYMLSFLVLRVQFSQIFRFVLLASLAVVLAQRKARERVKRALLLSWTKIAETVRQGTTMSGRP